MEIEDIAQTVILQERVNRVADWAHKWQLKLSLSKCQHMRVSLRKTNDISTSYSLYNNVLPSVLYCTDLGVRIDSSLSFSGHINSVVARAKHRASQIFRCFLSKDPATLTKAFVVYVRPILEFCSPVWSPCTITDINKLESVQRSFTKRLAGLRRISYNSRLSAVGLERLELRRLRADLVMCYKIVNGLVGVPFDAFFKFSEHQITRGHSKKLFYPDSRLNVRAHSFPIRVVSLWNRLPEAVVQTDNLYKFKKALSRIDLSYAVLGKE